MRPLDWVVLAASVIAVTLYGLWRGRHSNNVDRYLRAERSMPWYAMALSIMATQASAITFISTTGQSYVDGMRFLQFYFGLPLAMILISAYVVPVFHRANVYTAYEYLERRFDSKTRMLVSVIFLLQRGLAVGVALSAPAIVLTVILGWPDRWTTLIMGAVVVFYTVMGGIQAVTWTDFQQMLIMLAGLFIALVTAVLLLPSQISLRDAVTLAGAAGKLNTVTLHFDWNDQFNVWSGLFGGMFLMLAYFGCDQSQVQRYLTGRSITQSRLSLLFNAVAKLPMQFFILFTGAMVFVFFTFEMPPAVFQREALAKASRQPAFQEIQKKFAARFEERKQAAVSLVEASHRHDPALLRRRAAQYREAQRQWEAARSEALQLAREASGEPGLNDTNYIFLTFVTRYLPAGLVGLVMAAIFAAAMSTISAEINSLATVTVIDIYRRHLRRSGPDRHYLMVSRLATALWGAYAIITAQYARNLGSLIVVVNQVGSLFYGGLLGVFVLAYAFKRVNGTAAFTGVLCGEAAIFAAHAYGKIAFLWYNMIGCGVVVVSALLVSAYIERKRRQLNG